MARTRPIEDRVVVQFEDAAETSAGGIILPGLAKHEHPAKTGIVLAVGPGKSSDKSGRNNMHVDVGDKITFSGIAGLECPWDDLKNVLVITHDDILYVTEE